MNSSTDNSARPSGMLGKHVLASPLSGTWFDTATGGGRAPINLAASRRRAQQQAHAAASFHRHVLPAADFAVRLQREKRRCERSGSALSLIVYRFETASGLADAPIGQLLDALYALTRETDVFGRLADGTIAVLCTETDDKGVRIVIDKMAVRLGALPFTPVAATFPHQLFDAIEQGVGVTTEGDDLLAFEGTVETRRGYPGKRTLDVMLAAIAIVLAAPLMLVTALAIALESPGPVIYRQKRLGLGGVPFVFYKFRSMWSGVDDGVHRDFVLRLIERGDEAASTAPRASPYKLKSDARVTWVGRVIRKTSIDELPQLFNVLKGDMSLVGPRPPIPYEAANYQPWHLRRVLAIKPGITGLWQIDGRSRVGFNEMVRMDLRYIRDCSFLFDLRILLKTVLVVLLCDGAR
jgi:lipopolysaccharide/colanic/teichoic acid biosynthesis glycosyltransferase